MAFVALNLEKAIAKQPKERLREHGSTAPGRKAETLVPDPAQVKDKKDRESSERAAMSVALIYPNAEKGGRGKRARR